MEERAEIEAVLRAAYDARRRGDLDGVMAHFSPRAEFMLLGSPAASPVPLSALGIAAVREVLRRLMASFEFHDLELRTVLVEGNRAAVHWSARVRAPASGLEASTELLDLVRLEAGKIVSFKQFADTALASRLLRA
ncbi:nuclear transport factor 2 family protein [Enterovirga aerilata]|uniref:Nuclear transport factor 2 family protein n=1 Tax=Enterovirga aerilata TaxID=2730920 RepID=A0A849I338_9HYPH|nr:nuclear transport factor 2 family protein [Enterovirga sp. DB1703]NNM71761.1 nuclear transport factor 2 family protein [Enterovirga sp. DB1703]